MALRLAARGKTLAIAIVLAAMISSVPAMAYAEGVSVTSLLQSVLQIQRHIADLLSSSAFSINPLSKRVGIGTSSPASILDLHDASPTADTAAIIRYAGPLGHRAMLVLSNKGAGQEEGSAGIWTIAAGNKQTGILGQRLGISGHKGNFDPNYKFMLDFSGNLELGSESTPSGITLYDTLTKMPYCIRMTNGLLTPALGACSPQ